MQFGSLCKEASTDPLVICLRGKVLAGAAFSRFFRQTVLFQPPSNPNIDIRVVQEILTHTPSWREAS